MANQTVIIRLLAFIIASSLIALSNADVFSSAFKMGSLVRTRQQVIDELDAYVHKEEDRIQDFKRRINEYRVEQQNSLENVESYVANPVNAYILIKRLTVDLDHIRKCSKNTEFISKFSENKNKNVTILYPTSVDLSGAAKGLVRLQRMYKMTVEDMANGVIDGTIYYSLAMSASDCHSIGVSIFQTKNYLNSLPWHMEALKRFKSPDNTDDSITEIHILEYIGITYYHLGDMKSATDWTLKILAIDPDNVQAQNNIVVYENVEYANENHATPSSDDDADDEELNTREPPITNDSTHDNNETNQSDNDVNDNDTNETNQSDSDVNDNDTNEHETNQSDSDVNDNDTNEHETNQSDSDVNDNDTNEQSNESKHTTDNIENTVESEGNTKTTDTETKESKNSAHEENTKESKNATLTESTPTDDNIDLVAKIRESKVDYRKEMVMYEALCRGEFNVAPEMASRLHCRYIDDAPLLKIAPIKAEHWFFDPDVMLFHDVISDAEIEHVKRLGSNSLDRARVNSVDKNTSAVAEYRISQNTWIDDRDSPIIDRISKRIQHFTGLDLEWAESLQLANYGVAGHYEPHFDWSGSVADNFEPIDWERIATVMFYLSDVAQGGATVFPKLGLSVFPKKGSAIFWINLLGSMEGDRATRHAACPVLEGSKWVANKWIRLRGNEVTRPCGLEYQSEDDPRPIPAPVPKPEVRDPLIVRYKP